MKFDDERYKLDKGRKKEEGEEERRAGLRNTEAKLKGLPHKFCMTSRVITSQEV